MSSSVHTEPLVSWLRDQRRTIELQEALMTSKFDLDGALTQGQPELAWSARQSMIGAALELFLHRINFAPQYSADSSERLFEGLARLTEADETKADTMWMLLLAQAPQSLSDVGDEVQASLRMVDQVLHVGAGASREDLVRGWADGIRLLREIAASLGLAGSDGWYLTETQPGAQLSWYDQVLAAVS